MDSGPRTSYFSLLTAYFPPMSPLELLGYALGTSFASGLNLYATVAAAGLFERWGIIQLPHQLQVLAHPVVLGMAIALFVVEFVADKIPYIDSIWDAVHTFIRPPAAAVLSYSAFAGQVPEQWQVAAALVAAGVALTSHGAKASTRAAANMSPEPLSNWLLSLLEDGVAVFLAWAAPAEAGIRPDSAQPLVCGVLRRDADLLRSGRRARGPRAGRTSERGDTARQRPRYGAGRRAARGTHVQQLPQPGRAVPHRGSHTARRQPRSVPEPGR